MQQLQQSHAVDVDPEVFQGGPEMEPTKVGGVYIRFHIVQVENKLKSWGGVVAGEDGKEVKVKGEGRPIFEDVEYIEKVIPGDPGNRPDRPVTDADRKQFASQYRDWKAGVKASAAGTPVSAIVSVRRAKELEYFGVRTVEQYADVSDGSLQKMGPGSLLERQRCQDYLEVSKGNAPVAALRSELQQKDSKLEMLERQVKELSERLDAKERKKQ